jgi:cytoskeletal protein CcmA (bactofilin family)
MFSKPKSNEIKKASDVSTNEKVDTDLTETNYNIEKNIANHTENSPPSLLSTDLFIKGNLTTSGDIQIEGEVEGNIKASLLTVGQNAKIKGEINTNELIINGFVSGTIRSKKVTLTSSAKVEGDIIHNTIAIETGAHFEGSIEKTDNPLLKSDLKNGKLIN